MALHIRDRGRPYTEIMKRVWVPPHVRDGHPVGGYWRKSKTPKAAVPDLIPFVQHKLDTDGGLTFHRFTGKEPKEGYSVAVAPTESLEITPQVPPDEAEDLIAQWVHNHTRKRGPSFDDKGVYLGGWLDTATGHIWMDVVKVFPPDQLDAAVQAGQEANQIAIFDLKNAAEIPTHGTGQVAKGEPRMRRFIADASTEPYKLAEWIVAMRGAIGKAEPRDGDGDGFVYDGTPQQRPVGRVSPVKIIADRKKKFTGRDGTNREHKYKLTVHRGDSASTDESRAAATEAMTVGGKNGPMAGFASLDNPNAIFDQMVGNLEVLHREAVRRETADGFITRTKQWYDGANLTARQLSEDSTNPDLTPDAAAGVLAVLSASMDWDNNVFGAREVIEIADENPPVDEHIRQRFIGLVTALNERADGSIKRPGQRGYTDAPVPEIGTRLMDIDDPTSRAIMLRAFSVRRHGGRPTTPLLQIKDGVIVPRDDGAKQKTRYQSAENIAKALSIYEHPTHANLDRQLGSGVKVRSFYNNISNPNDDHGDVTIDTHAASSLVGAPFAANTEPFKTITEKSDMASGPFVKLMMIDAYREIARRHPEQYRYPREAQSVLWELWRESAVPSTAQDKALKDELRQAWADVDAADVRDAAVDRARTLMRRFVSRTATIEKRVRFRLG